MGCVRVLCRWGGGSEGVCGVWGGGVLFGLGLGRLRVWGIWGRGCSWDVIGCGYTSGVIALYGCVGIVEMGV